MALRLTFPERVTDHNLHKLRARVLNGSFTWPGANFVIKVGWSRGRGGGEGGVLAGASPAA
jgi:DNA-directed RNA polymerase III subunit RPC1